MKQFVCENVFVPLRAMPSHKSEMFSQVLFGEKYIIIDQVPGWIKIEMEFDGYSGWIDKSHLQHSEATACDTKFVLNRNLSCQKPDGTKMVIEAGSEIYEPDFNKKTFRAGENIYKAYPEFSEKYISEDGTVSDTALRFINSPYLWGGRIPSGIDCSGLTQLVYKIHGITIPRDSWKQAEKGETVEFIKDARPGDLVFFDNELGKISHVGMIISEGLVIHGSGRVRIDIIDHQGIFRREIGEYSHHLRLIKRIST
ncbi:MAG: C40 family peptidase [Bacteroidales bacterium]